MPSRKCLYFFANISLILAWKILIFYEEPILWYIQLLGSDLIKAQYHDCAVGLRKLYKISLPNTKKTKQNSAIGQFLWVRCCGIIADGWLLWVVSCGLVAFSHLLWINCCEFDHLGLLPLVGCCGSAAMDYSLLFSCYKLIALGPLLWIDHFMLGVSFMKNTLIMDDNNQVVIDWHCTKVGVFQRSYVEFFFHHN